MSVESIIANAESSAKEFSASATTALDKASQVAQTNSQPAHKDLGFTDTSELPKFNFSLPNAPNDYVKPDFQGNNLEFLPLNAVEKPIFPTPVTINTAGLFNQQAPAYTEKTAPTTPQTDIASISSEINAINKPNIHNPETPKAIAVKVPSAPQVNLPTFSASLGDTSMGNAPDINTKFLNQYKNSRPEIQAWVDGQLEKWMGQYAPTLKSDLATLQAKLNQDMVTGNALSPEFEASLYNRARSKIANEVNRVKHEIEKGMSKRGFALPPAALSAGLVNASQSASNNIAQQATEIAIERAKMEVQHVQFVMSLSNTIQQSLLANGMTYLSSIADTNRQCIELSKQVAVNLNDMYNNRFKLSTLTIEVFNAEINTYEVQLKSALSVVEEYKIQIEAAKLTKDIEKTDIALYQSRIDSENTKIKQYLALLDATSKKAEIEKAKIEVFGEEVKAYVAGIQGEETKFKVYNAAIQGDTAKMNAELSKLEVYEKEIEAEATKSKVSIANNEAIISQNKNKAFYNEYFIDKYKADVEAEKSKYLADIDSYKARMSAVSENNKMQQEYFQAQYSKAALSLSYEKERYEGSIKQAIENTRLNIEQMKIQAETGIQVGRVYGTMAGAALSSQNTMTSLTKQQI